MTKAELTAALEQITIAMRNAAVLHRIETTGRTCRMIFTRNNAIIPIDFYITWDDDVAGWRRVLLEVNTNG